MIEFKQIGPCVVAILENFDVGRVRKGRLELMADECWYLEDLENLLDAASLRTIADKLDELNAKQEEAK